MKDLIRFKRNFSLRLEEVKFLVNKTNKSSVLVIQQFPRDEDSVTLLPKVRESISNIIAFVELGDPEVLKHVLEEGENVFDAIIMDVDMNCSFSESLISLMRDSKLYERVFYFSDSTTLAHSAVEFVQNIEKNLTDKNVLITGLGILTNKIILTLLGFGANVHWLDVNSDPKFIELASGYFVNKNKNTLKQINNNFNFSEIDFVVGSAIKTFSISSEVVLKLKDKANLYDVGTGNFSSTIVEMAEKKNCGVYRLDNRAGISSMVLSLFETNYLINKVMGKVKIKDVELVSGGVMGHEGAIIVDNVNDPSYIIGVADGEGKVKYAPENEKEVKDFKLIQQLISN